MMRFPLKLSLAATLLMMAFGAGSGQAEETLGEQARKVFEPIPQSAPVNPADPATPEKLLLGKMLFFEPRLVDAHDISCAACHNISMGGVDGGELSGGRNAQLAGRDVQTVLNAVFNKSQYWDGRASDLKDQVVNSVMANPKAMLKTRGGPMAINPMELAASKQRAIDELKSVPAYVEAFKKAFPGQAEPLVYENIGRAISLFEATLITPDAPFDRWLMGDDDALTDEQKSGAKLFMDKGCAACHNGVNIGGASYAKFGVAATPPAEYLPADDQGRFGVTKAISDRYVFKIPSLRNVELTGPYFHNGATFDLSKAVSVMGAAQLGVAFSDDDNKKIVAFLKSLTGRQPDVTLPILPPRTH